jgi:hypothetical protein
MLLLSGSQVQVQRPDIYLARSLSTWTREISGSSHFEPYVNIKQDDLLQRFLRKSVHSAIFPHVRLPGIIRESKLS